MLFCHHFLCHILFAFYRIAAWLLLEEDVGTARFEFIKINFWCCTACGNDLRLWTPFFSTHLWEATVTRATLAANWSSSSLYLFSFNLRSNSYRSYLWIVSYEKFNRMLHKKLWFVLGQHRLDIFEKSGIGIIFEFVPALAAYYFVFMETNLLNAEQLKVTCVVCMCNEEHRQHIVYFHILFDVLGTNLNHSRD